MKKRSHIISVLVLFIMAFMLFGCKTDEVTTEDPNMMSLNEVYDLSNSASVTAIGTVYLVLDEGFFIEQEVNGNLYYIYCIKPENSNVKLKDSVLIRGNYSFFESRPRIVNISTLEVLSENNEIKSGYDFSSVTDLSSNNYKTKSSYGKSFTTHGTLSLSDNDSYKYMVTDLLGSKIYLDSEEEISEYSEYLDKIVEFKSALLLYNKECGWVSVSPESFNEGEYLFSEVKAYAKKSLDETMPSVAYNKMMLPESPLEGLTFSFESSNEAVYNAATNTVTVPSETVNVKVTTTISYKEETETFEHTIKFLSGDVQSVSEFNQNRPEVVSSTVKVEGIVSGILRNQGTSGNYIYTVILKDESTSDICNVVVKYSDENINTSSSEFTGLALGDKVTVTGNFNIGGTYAQTINSLTSLVESESELDYEIDKETATILKTKADYEEFASDLTKHIGELVKFENPYVMFSSSEGTVASFLQLFPTEDALAKFNTTNVYGLCLIVNDLTYGDNSWYKGFNIPSKNSYASQIGISFYAHLIPSTGATLQFVMADSSYLDCDESVKVENYIKVNTTTEYYKDSTVSFVETYRGVNISFESTNSSLLNVSTKKVTLSSSSEKVTLKAKFSIDEEEFSVDIPVYLSGKTTSSSNAMEVSAIRALNENSAVFGNGFVIGFASETNASSLSSHRQYKGVIVLDCSTGDTLVLDGIEYRNNCVYPSLVYDGTSQRIVGIGDHIRFAGMYYKDSNRVDVTNGLFKFIQSTNLEISDSFCEVVRSQAELEELFTDGTPFGKIIKLIGTEESPLYFTPTSVNTDNTGKMNYRIHYNGNATKVAATTYGTRSIVLKQDTNVVNSEDAWYTKLGLPSIGISGDLYPGIKFVGSMYIVICYDTTSSDGINYYYHQSAIINYSNWTLSKVE